jgi:RNA polymerase sigma-70 factor, ECF subfamily
VTSSLRELVLCARRGDQGAFAQLHGRYRRMVHAILLARLPPADADDQVQEVFLTAWTKLVQLDDPEGFGAWLGAIARHRAIDWARRRRPMAPLPDTLADPRAQASSTAEVRNVLDAVQALPEAYRETLLMRLARG